MLQEDITNEAIGDTLNAARGALEKMTPGSEVFKGSGFITNKYDAKKGYYPNIRSGFMGLVNKSLDAAGDELTSHINKLIQEAETKKILDPDTDISKTGLGDIITEKYSKGFVSGIIENFNADVTKLQTVMNTIQGDKSVVSYTNLMEAIKNFMTKRNSKQQSEIIRTLEEYKNNLANPSYLFGLSFLHKSAINNNIIYFETQLAEWEMLLKASGSTGNVQEDSEDTIGAFLNSEGKVYRNLWVDFLKKLLNATVGQGDRWRSTVTTYGLVTAKLYGKYTSRTGERSLELSTISPQILETFHKKVMITRFMTNPKVLIYCTPEQWASIEEGGNLYKGITGAAGQAFTAGKNAPKVSL